MRRAARRVLRAVLLASGLALVVSAPPVHGQEDFRSADLDRPIRVEDAHPIKFREWEFEVGARGTVAEGSRGLQGLFELKAGLLRNAQIGLELEGALEGSTGEASESGLESVGMHVLYGILRETTGLPAVGLRFDVHTPGAGSARHEDWQFGAKGLLTRGFGRTRAHVNAGYMVASAADGGDYWRFGLGVDRPIGLFSRNLLADVYAEVPVDDGRTRVWAELGTRIQTGNLAVLDIGLGTRLDEWERGAANLEITVGLSRMFGVPGGVRVGPYPDPAIP